MNAHCSKQRKEIVTVLQANVGVANGMQIETEFRAELQMLL